MVAVPTFVAVRALTQSYGLAALVTCATLFGGLMFGPDLDIQSKQYTRWGLLRLLWLPYRAVFKHRSRWSHGIIFGTLIRVLYFTGVLVLVASAAFYLYVLLRGGAVPGLAEMAERWRAIEASAARTVGRNAVWATLAGLWWGAATHTLTDVIWSMLRKGSEIF